MFGRKKKNEDFNVEASDVKTQEELEIEKKEKEKEDEEKEEQKKQARTERRHSFINAAFILKMLAAAFLLAIGIWFLVDRDSAKMIVITTSGVLVALLCLGRIIWLFKDKNSTKRFKYITFAEIALETIVALFLIYSGIKYQTGDKDDKSKFIEFVEDNYRFFIGAVIYLRGVMHFFAVSFFKSKVSVANFIINIGFITLGTFCIFSDKASVSNIAWVMIVLIFIGFIYLAGDGVHQYIKWKKGPGNNGENRVEKEKMNKKDKEITPTLNIDNIDEAQENDNDQMFN